MRRAGRLTQFGLLLLGLAVVTTSVLTVTGVLFGRGAKTAAAQVTPLPDVSGMTKQDAVQTLRAAGLRPVVRYTPHAKGQPSGLVVGAPVAAHPISVGRRHLVGVVSEGDVVPNVVPIFVSR